MFRSFKTGICIYFWVFLLQLVCNIQDPAVQSDEFGNAVRWERLILARFKSLRSLNCEIRPADYFVLMNSVPFFKKM
jgi:hypothetical protein